MAINFSVYQLQQIEGAESTSLRGILVERAAKTTHKHRKDDLLLLHLVLSGEHRYEDSEIHALLEEASGIFFHTKGSVTHAIQESIENVNKKILERNLERGYEGIQASGSINVGVLHNKHLFFGQVGDANAYVITSDDFRIYGAEGDDLEKLGVSKRIAPRFFQSEFAIGDLLMMSPNAPASWKAYYLAKSNELSMPQIKRRLQNQMIQDFEVVVIKGEEGSGKVVFNEWEEIFDQAAADQVISKPAETEKALTIEDPIEKQQQAPLDVPDEQALRSETVDPPQSSETPEDYGVESGTIEITPGKTEPGDYVLPGKAADRNANIDGQKTFLIRLAGLWLKLRTVRAKYRLFSNRIMRKIFPQKSEPDTKEPSVILLGMSLFIPAVLIVSSVTMFSRIGKEEQYEVFMVQAREQVQLAEGESDKAQQKEYWQNALELAGKAEQYRVTNESRQLFTSTQLILDEMDLTARLDFRPAMTQLLPEGSEVSRIKGGTSGVYLLEKNTGSILRLFLNTKGFYELDTEFSCMPGTYGLVTITKLLDFVMLPANSENFKIMAIDAQGNLLYCQPGEPPVSNTLTLPPGGWGSIARMVYANESLYIADADKSNVWIYDGSSGATSGMSGIIFAESPVQFFDETIPDLGGAIAMAINQEDLFILHGDGHMTLCQYSALKEAKLTECEDPAPYTDNRFGSENKKPWIFMGTNFMDMQYVKLPNASLLVLDGISGTLYKFSLQLNLEQTLKLQANPDYPIPTTAPTGFGVTHDKELFLAFSNQIFSAPLQ